MKDTDIKLYVENFLAQFDALTNEEKNALGEVLMSKLYTKNSILLKQGDSCDRCFFILKGCVREFIIDSEGNEITTQFYTEQYSIAYFNNYIENIPSNHFLICTEDTILLDGGMDNTDIFQKFPKLESITRRMMEERLGKLQETLSRFIASSPEERYMYLSKDRPDLLQRVPQHQIASYIGVTPESLSRIRKRLSQS